MITLGPYYNRLAVDDILTLDELNQNSSNCPFTTLTVSHSGLTTQADNSQSSVASSEAGSTVPVTVQDKCNVLPLPETVPQIRKSSLAASIAHTTNYFIGVGVLGLPYAFRCSGWVGLPVLVLLGVLMAYSGRLIGRCLKEYSLSTYPDMAEV